MKLFRITGWLFIMFGFVALLEAAGVFSFPRHQDKHPALPTSVTNLVVRETMGRAETSFDRSLREWGQGSEGLKHRLDSTVRSGVFMLIGAIWLEIAARYTRSKKATDIHPQRPPAGDVANRAAPEE
jgi:hypothetical protein